MTEPVKMKFKDAPVGARFKFPWKDELYAPDNTDDDIWIKLNSFPKSRFQDGDGLIVKWNGNVEGRQSFCKWVDEENGYDFDTEIELI
jgi:hypothetical protein